MNKFLKNNDFQIFRHISEENTVNLLNAQDKSQYIASIQNLDNTAEDLTLKLFLVKIIEFCVENSFTAVKSATVISIFIDTLQQFNLNNHSLDNSLKFLKNIISLHSTDRPPYSIHIFDSNDINIITTQFEEELQHSFKHLRQMRNRNVETNIVTELMNDKLRELKKAEVELSNKQETNQIEEHVQIEPKVTKIIDNLLKERSDEVIQQFGEVIHRKEEDMGTKK